MRGGALMSDGLSGPSILISKKKGAPLSGYDGSTRLKSGHESRETFVKRQRKKVLSQSIVRELLPFEESRMQSQYRRAMNCGNIVEQRDGKLTTWYCKTRPCLVCNGIRTAMLIDAYRPVVESWREPTLVTLTVPNVALSELRSTVDSMAHQFRLIIRQLRRAGHEIGAVRVTEVTGNSVDSLHPHFHVLARSEALGRAILDSWLERHPKAVRAAQDVREADTESLRELFKYLTKLTSTDRAPKVLDGILSEMWGKHLVRPYGFRLETDPMNDEAFDELVPTNTEFKRHGESILWVWHDEIGNWIDHTTGELLVDSMPPFGLSGFA